MTRPRRIPLALVVMAVAALPAAPSQATATAPVGTGPAAVASAVPGSPLNLYAAYTTSTATLVHPIPLATHALGAGFAVAGPRLLISPDGTTLYALGSSIAAYDAASGALVRSVAVPDPVVGAAIAPAGRTIWYTTSGPTGEVHLASYSTGSGRLGTPRALGVGLQAPIVITPDGRTAYVGVRQGVIPVSLSSTVPGPLIPISEPVNRLAMAPDGRRLFAATSPDEVDFHPSRIWPISLPDGTVGAFGPQTVSDGAQEMRLGPDGASLWVAESFTDSPGNARFVGYDPATLVPHVAIPAGRNYSALAVTPDGTAAYLGVGGTLRVLRVDLGTGEATSPVAQRPSNGLPDMVITPAQAPTAAFSSVPAPHGSVTTFDGSASSGTSADVVRWSWQFGDGTRVTRSVPTAKHTYTAPGRYVVTLTVTDANGTSTTRVYHGTGLYRNGRALAKARQEIVIP